jgi:gamma-glutamyltranspeptidase/glutathione hydrolase/leukotriene-C4 hydrolase
MRRCSEIGAAVLADGGNAVDAAVATALCQGVVSPISSGLGGGDFITIRLANGSAEFINAREFAPGAASTHMYDGKGGGSCCGGLSAGQRQTVPHSRSACAAV